MSGWPAREHGPELTGKPDEPWWTREAIIWMESYLKTNMSVLEWGAGASTLWIAKRVKTLATIEHNLEWANRVRQNDLEEPDNYCITTMPLNHTYYDCIRNWTPNLDAVIVDGRLRMFCCEAGSKVLKPGGILLLDNAERERYRKARDLFPSWPVIETNNGIWQTNIWIKPDA